MGMSPTPLPSLFLVGRSGRCVHMLLHAGLRVWPRTAFIVVCWSAVSNWNSSIVDARLLHRQFDLI